MFLAFPQSLRILAAVPDKFKATIIDGSEKGSEVPAQLELLFRSDVFMGGL